MGLDLSTPLGALCLVVALFHLGRLARRDAVPSAIAHAVMGLGMAAMFVPALDPIPRPVWITVFVVSGAWFAATALRGAATAGDAVGDAVGDAAHHVVGAVAMLFMLLGGHHHSAAAMAADPEHAQHAMGAGGTPSLLTTGLALLLAGWFLTDIVRTVLRQTATGQTATGQTATGQTATGPATPGGTTTGVTTTGVTVPTTTSVAAHLAMSVAMAVMLLGMA
jgi:hypothetical protein